MAGMSYLPTVQIGPIEAGRNAGEVRPPAADRVYHINAFKP